VEEGVQSVGEVAGVRVVLGELPVGVGNGLCNALGDSLQVESKQGKGGWSASEGPQRRWHAAHLKRDGSGATLVASQLEGGGVAWLQASAWQNLRGGAEEHSDLRRPARRDDSGTRGSSTTEWFTEKVWQRCDEGVHWAGDGFHDWQWGNT
jgi:hypothetical protein